MLGSRVASPNTDARETRRFLRIEGPEADTAENRGSLAARIVVVAKLGETDERAMADAALLYLRAFLAARALPGGKRSTAVPATGGAAGPVLDQESISAAAAAYETCLEELPEGIFCERALIPLQSVLANAGKGHRDAAQLRELALRALRSRK